MCFVKGRSNDPKHDGEQQMFRHGINSGEWWCEPGSLFPGPLGMIFTLLFWAILLFLLFKGPQILFSIDQKEIKWSPELLKIC